MSLNSSVKVSVCRAEELTEAFCAVSRGFAHDAPFFDAYFPLHDTVTGQAQATARLSPLLDSDTSSLIKASIVADDGASEKIVGMAIWTHMKESPSDSLEELEDVNPIWPELDDRQYMQRLWKDYVIPRGDAVKRSEGAGVYVLELLGVDREYQYKGCGSALVSWGTDAADRKGIEAVVEGTPQGLKCYHNAGFETMIELMTFDVGSNFADREPPVLSFLSRAARK